MPLALKLCSAAVDKQRSDEPAASLIALPPHAGTLSPARAAALRALPAVEESRRRKAAARKRCIAVGNSEQTKQG